MERAKQLRDNRLFLEETKHPFKPEVNSKRVVLSRNKDLDSLDIAVISSTTDLNNKDGNPNPILYSKNSDILSEKIIPSREQSYQPSNNLQVEGLGKFKSNFMQQYQTNNIQSPNFELPIHAQPVKQTVSF